MHRGEHGVFFVGGDHDGAGLNAAGVAGLGQQGVGHAQLVDVLHVTT